MNSESILFPDWRVRSGVETHARDAYPSGKVVSAAGQAETFRDGRISAINPREAPCPYRRIRIAGLHVIPTRMRSVGMARNSLKPL